MRLTICFFPAEWGWGGDTHLSSLLSELESRSRRSEAAIGLKSHKAIKWDKEVPYKPIRAGHIGGLIAREKLDHGGDLARMPDTIQRTDPMRELVEWAEMIATRDQCVNESGPKQEFIRVWPRA